MFTKQLINLIIQPYKTQFHRDRVRLAVQNPPVNIFLRLTTNNGGNGSIS